MKLKERKNAIGKYRLSSMIMVAVIFLSMGLPSILAESDTTISVKVFDVYGNSVVNATVYAIKNPFDKKSLSIVGFVKTEMDGIAAFSVDQGQYSIGAYDPQRGWDVKVINITPEQKGKGISVTLTVRPLVEKWIDLNGNVYYNLTSWPFLKPLKTSTSTTSQGSTMYLGGILIRRETYSMLETKIGETYSVDGLTVDLTLKYSSQIDTKTSIDGGPLQVTGYTSEGSATVVSLPSVSDGDSRTTYAYYDYVYEHWIGNFSDAEIWYENKIYPGSAHYGSPYPSPSVKSLDQVNDIGDSRDTDPSQTKTIVRDYSKYQGAGFSVGVSITLTGTWDIFSGSVTLGGSYQLNYYSAYETVYTLRLQGGRMLYIYEWNIAGPLAKGIVLTYQNKYWARSVQSYGSQGGGWVGNPNNIIGHTNDLQYAHIHAPNAGDAAWIAVDLERAVSGKVYFYGYSEKVSSIKYTSRLRVYVSATGTSWTQISEQWLPPRTVPYYIYCGQSSNFRYVKFYVYYYSGYSAGVNLDAVHVVSTD